MDSGDNGAGSNAASFHRAPFSCTHWGEAKSPNTCQGGCSRLRNSDQKSDRLRGWKPLEATDAVSYTAGSQRSTLACSQEQIKDGATGLAHQRDHECAHDACLVALCRRWERGGRGKVEHGGVWISARR